VDRLRDFLRPLLMDVDGVSRLPDADRVAAIAKQFHTPQDPRAFELLLLFRALGNWLEKVGNLTRVVLAVGVPENELRAVAQSIRRLEAPVTPDERAVAAAVLIDESGARGLAQRFAHARREGQSVEDVVREALNDSWIPEWVPPAARPVLEARIDARRAFCAAVLDES
jgi:hypothetical protein